MEYSANFVKVPREAIAMLEPMPLVVYLKLLGRARFQAGTVMTKHGPLHLEAGQAVFGRAELARECSTSERTIRTSTRRLQSVQILTIRATKRGSIATLCGYSETYQREPSERPSERPTSDQQPAQRSTKRRSAERPVTETAETETREARPADRVREHYATRFSAAHNGTAPTWSEVQGKRLKDVLRLHSADEVIRRVDIAFDHPELWPPDRDFLTIASPKHFDRFAAAPRGRQGPPAAPPRAPARVTPPREVSIDGRVMPLPSERPASVAEATVIPITNARRAERQPESTEPERDVPAVPDLFGSC